MPASPAASPPATERRAIRTPDHRLRVFVSSTLKELSRERKAARSAIERLRLAPVMFELGARPHPPRELYRSYLEQSDIFVGIYAERYGWLAPGETVSGLEDEYRLAPPAMPKLVYVAESSPAREPRLTALLDSIRDGDSVSYTSFSSPDELGALLEADLAMLLAERFEQSRKGEGSGPGMDLWASTLPSPMTELIGREREVCEVVRMLGADSVRLVTIAGPGGIGKTRVALAAASAIAADRDVAFVDLADARRPQDVVEAIAQEIGVRDSGEVALGDKLSRALRHRRLLLLLDNFEQVRDGAPLLRDLLEAAPGVALLVTSRSLLRVSGERALELGPLRVADPGQKQTVSEVAVTPSIALFVDRARAVKPDFALTEANVDIVKKICAALDGVPLALELAAAGIRILPPAALLARLEQRRPLPPGPVRDLPERQRTPRRTIEWSVELLSSAERSLLTFLAVFSNDFSLEAVEHMWSNIGGRDDALDIVSSLVDSSLVQQQDRHDRPMFSLLGSVREYGLEQLERSGGLAEMRSAHARFYVDLGASIELELEGQAQPAWVSRLTDERNNLRAAMRHLVDSGEFGTATRFAWYLYIYWWAGGHLGEVQAWMDEVLSSDGSLSDLERAIALYFTNAIGFWQDPDGRVLAGLVESADLFRHAGERSGEALALISMALAVLAAPAPEPATADTYLERSLLLFQLERDSWGEAFTLVTMGRVALMSGRTDAAREHFGESLRLARGRDDKLATAIALHHLGWAALLLGDDGTARKSFEENLSMSAGLGHVEGIAYGLEGLVALDAADPHRAGVLSGAAHALRERAGTFNAPAFSFHERFIEGLRSGATGSAFAQAEDEGRAMSPDDAVLYALAPLS